MPALDTTARRPQSLGTFLLELGRMVRPDRRRLTLLVALTLVEVLAGLVGPFLFAWLIGRLLDGIQTADLLFFGGCMLGLQLLQGLLGILRVRLNRRFALEAAGRLRDTFFAHLLRLPWTHFLDHHAGGQANSYLNDIDDVDRAVSGLIEHGARTLFAILVFGAALLIWNPLFGVLVLALLPATIWAQRRIRAVVRNSSRERVDLRDTLVSQAAEAVGNASLVKVFTMEAAIERRFAATQDEFVATTIALETWQAALRSSAAVLLIGVQYAFFVIGALLVMHDQLALPAFLGQVLLIGRMTGPMTTLMEYINGLGRSQGALHRVRDALHLAPEAAAATRDLPALSGDLVLAARDLRFRFDPASPLIEGWDLDLHAGERLALVGASGCGKTTFLQLLLGLHEGYRGSLRLAGIEVRELRPEALRRHLGAVFQEAQLFNASVRDNLALAWPGEPEAADEAALWRALALAHADDFVQELPHGLDTPVGENGVQLSGGQRQRLALAQAILRDPPLLLLDEATAALDSFSERHIQEALRSVLAGRASIVVAHRLSTVRDADHIAVIDDGRIAQLGAHAELIARPGPYRDLFLPQLEERK